jgi:nicotinamide-nucleotide amidase
MQFTGGEEMKRDRAEVEIITIGNEILQGVVLDSNTHWLCQQLSARGAQVTRVAIVLDLPEAIADALHSALHRHPDLVLLTGGLGPTADDLTIQAASDALDRSLQVDPVALDMVRATYVRLTAEGIVADSEMTASRRKMAAIPNGASPVHNPVGAAPGVVLRQGESLVVFLPGVPEEMKAIFDGPLEEQLLPVLGTGILGERSLLTDCGDESVLAPAVDGVAALYPAVYVKSRARPYGEGVRLRIMLAKRGVDGLQVRSDLDEAQEALEVALKRLGVGVLEVTQTGQ